MTSREICGLSQDWEEAVGTGDPEVLQTFWLQEIAFQLAVLNESCGHTTNKSNEVKEDQYWGDGRLKPAPAHSS